MPAARRPVTFRVRFEPLTFADDLAQTRPAGRTIGEAARAQLERDGVDAALLMPCQDEHRDGTDLGGLVKLYLPIPYGDWGLVLEAARDTDGLYLLVVAFGERHPARGKSVYAIAHHRRHGSWPTPAGR